ncbi:hypothetical protein [Pseudothioclava nitratireducens]|uniref:hypothetical protein n=1 Tax=Pseudothioclava nitratireducens TaxID=1928646 RepID=UPI0023DA396C|nr:hypothetical protein [Defluviimonas nitratireducens]MDF1619059.1 hypothetical protein [Defluviimonas nitratireducens]
MKRAAFALILSAVALTACGTPQEQCIQRNTRELRTVERLLAEVEGNLARGYAYEEYEWVTKRWEVCGYDQITRPDGSVERKARRCLEDHVVTRTRQVAIDPASETRKRDALLAKRKLLVRQAEAAVQACKAAYPE